MPGGKTNQGGTETVKRYSRTLVVLTIAMGVVVGTATARTLEFSSLTFRVTWASLTFAGEVINIRCPVTFEGSLHSRNMLKTAGSLIGYVTAVSVDTAACAGGRARANGETLPWHVRYRSFIGTLPNITSISADIVGATFEVEAEGFCAWTRLRGTATGQFNREVRGALTGVVASGSLPRVSGGFCPNPTLSGTSSAPTVLGTTTRITVTLI